MNLYQAQPLAKEWERITHKSLFELIMPVWIANGECWPDPVKIDRWLETPQGMSSFDRLRFKYGQRAVEIIETLINEMKY